MSKFFSALQARRGVILGWVAAVLAIYGVVHSNRSTQAGVIASLASPNLATRDAEALDLARHDRLTDTLAVTSDPNQDATSPKNKKSLMLRQNTADSINRLLAQGKLDKPTAFRALFALHKDADVGVQGKATDGLTTLGKQNDSNLRVLVQDLKDNDPDVRGAAAAALGKIGGDKVATLVDPHLKDPPAQSSAQAAMTAIGPAAVPFLVAHLHDPNSEFVQQVIGMLAAIGSADAVPALVDAAQTGPPSVHRLAVVTLANLILSTSDAARKATAQTAPAAMLESAKTRAAEPVLRAALLNPEEDSEARAQAALALGRSTDPATILALVSALGDYDARVAQSAVAGIQSVGAPAVGGLTSALGQGTAQTRASAAEALGGIGTDPAIAALNAAFANPSTPVSVRRSAVMGLSRTGSAATVPTLMRALSDPDGTVASAASDALVSLSPDADRVAIPQLIAAFDQPSPLPFNASQTLGRLGDLAVPALVAATSSGRPQTQTWAAVTLGQTGSKDPQVANALKPLTQSANPQVQFAATQSLGQLTGA